jgi:hypothetical protein
VSLFFPYILYKVTMIVKGTIIARIIPVGSINGTNCSIAAKKGLSAKIIKIDVVIPANPRE